MKKVFQTIIDPEKGNCMQAAFASMFDLRLNQVPNFIEMGEEWFTEIQKFVKTCGYEHVTDLYNGDGVLDEFHIKQINNYTGVNGFFIASVGSPKYYSSHGSTHIVVADKNLEIAHDPSPAYQEIKDYPDSDIIGYHGIRQIWIFEKLQLA
jgi:hypothetical protein